MAFNWFKKKDKKPSEDHGPEQPVEKQADVSISEAAGEPPAENPEIDPAPADHSQASAAEPGAESQGDEGPAGSGGFFGRLKKGLTKTREFLSTDIEDLFSGGRKIDDDLLEELEERLITADIGVQTTMDLMARISRQSAAINDAAALKGVLKSEILQMIEANAPEFATAPATPHVIMVVGVNGVGKTTTIGKLAAHFTQAGNKVLIAAADTFRAAAIEQLTIWAQRAGAEIVRHKDGSDPAAVAFDAMEAALARGSDIVLVDTAGRLHTKVNLMEELKKIKRAVSKKQPEAPHEILLVLDATTGQNALSQARLFNEALDITGIALTKLDGTAKGGIVVSICSALNIPLKYIGVGEQIDDFQVFDPAQFVQALF